jgi:NodT family efflux transporter outer membrane factor (OMF) lipoprotein
VIFARVIAVAAGAAVLAACTAGPDYRKPAVEIPAAWKLEAPWRVSVPGDTAAKGSWWESFADPQLNALARQTLAGSPTIAAANARLAQARAAVTAASSGLFPQIALGLRAARQRISANRPLTNNAAPNFTTTQSDFIGAFSVNYEADVFGRVRRGVEGARASAEQSAADVENIRLLLIAELAANYFSLREIDVELNVLSRSIDLQKDALKLVAARHELGAASGLDLAQQQALLDSTLTQVDVLRKQRSQFEHAVATLSGTPAPNFSLKPDLTVMTPPTVPIGVPSELLERRPDVASAERAMAAANAQIGVANAAFYPSITLGSAYGGESTSLDTLFATPSIIWSLGTALTQSIFDAGRLRANADIARSGYDAAVANYRRVVLIAMQEVEDGITGVATLERAYAQAQDAIASTTRVLELANIRYEGGVSTYLDVIIAQQALLNSERQAAQLLGQRMLTSVFLVKALGGDWQGVKTLATK